MPLNGSQTTSVYRTTERVCTLSGTGCSTAASWTLVECFFRLFVEAVRLSLAGQALHCTVDAASVLWTFSKTLGCSQTRVFAPSWNVCRSRTAACPTVYPGVVPSKTWPFGLGWILCPFCKV